MNTMEVWGVFAYLGGKLELVSTRDGVSEEQAREMAARWNQVTNTDWYAPYPMRQERSDQKIVWVPYTDPPHGGGWRPA